MCEIYGFKVHRIISSLVISDSLCLDYWILVKLRLVNKILFEMYSQIIVLAPFKLSIDRLFYFKVTISSILSSNTH